MTHSASERSKLVEKTKGNVSTTNDHEREFQKFGLKRTIGLFSGVFVATNIMFGSGIFVSPNEVFKATNGSVGISLLMWLLGGVVASLSALCYGELVTSVPESGGNYTYFYFAYGPAVAFLYFWMQVVVPAGNASQVTVFANYALTPFLPEGCVYASPLAVKCVAVCLILLSLFINSWSVRSSVGIQTILVAFKFLGMLLIFVGTIIFQVKRSNSEITTFENAFDFTLFKGITFVSSTSAFYQIMWSYEGWSALPMITEEVQNAKNVLMSNLLTIAIVTVSYLLLNVSYFIVLSSEELLSSQMVASTFANTVFGEAAWLAPLTICICSAGTVISSFLTHGRLSFVAARREQLPMIFSMIHTELETPIPGLCCEAFFVIILVLIGNLNMLIDGFGFVSWTFFALNSAAVLVLRYRRPDFERPFKVWTVVPVLVFLISIFFVVTGFLKNFHFVYIYIIIFFLLGVIVYHLLVAKSYSFDVLDKLTRFLQSLFSLAPAHWDKLE